MLHTRSFIFVAVLPLSLPLGACKSSSSSDEVGDGDGSESADTTGDGDGDSGDGDGDGDGDGSPECGDGVVEGDEQCDDGNQNDADACLNDCTLPACGDGVLQANEQCDDGNRVNDDACTNLCQANVCGDGFLWADAEECDDGNDLDADGCETDCTLAACANGVVDPGEVCFADAQSLALTGTVLDVAIADVDGDGDLDLVAVSDAVIPLTTWLGDGAGGLGDPISSGAVAGSGTGLFVVDVDGDDVPDAVHGAIGVLAVEWGAGDGSFDSLTAVPSPQTPLYSVVVGDFDGSGELDLACAHGAPFTTGFSVLLNQGNHVFTPSGLGTSGAPLFHDLSVADLENDGDDDLGGFTGPNMIVWRQSAPGSFTLESHGSASAGWSVAFGSLDAGDRLDAALTNADPMASQVMPFLQGDDNSFEGQEPVDVPSAPRGAALADLSADGNGDVVVALSGDQMAILVGDGMGGLAAPITFASGINPVQVATGDLDGDGVPDIAVANAGGSVSVFMSAP